MNISKRSLIDRKDCFFLEGVKKISELLETGRIEKIILSGSFKDCPENGTFLSRIEKKRIPSEVLKDREFLKISSVVTPQGVIGVFRKGCSGIIDFMEKAGPAVIALDAVQDPGNVGAVMRSALASGFRDIIGGQGCASFYLDKTLSAFTGSPFSLNLLDSADIGNALDILSAAGYMIVTADAREGETYYEFRYPDKFVLVFGNEGKGISQAVRKKSDYGVRIPLSQKTDSLNIAVSAGIIMFDFIRRYNLS